MAIVFRSFVVGLAAVAASAAPAPPTVHILHDMANVPAGGPNASLLAWPPAPPYSHTVKDLGSSASAAACQAKCAAYRNTDASPVSGWARCESFTWLPSGRRCIAVVDASQWAPTAAHGAVVGRLTWPPAACASAADCSHNGRCGADHLCACDAAWRGDRCQTLALLPTARGAGLRLVDGGRNTSTWGGSAVLDPATGLLHMWSSEMLGHCGIDSWTTNSHVIHAVSTDGGRTFQRRATKHNGTLAAAAARGSPSPPPLQPPPGAGTDPDPSEVWPAFSHEPNVVRAPTGEWVMYWTALDAGVAPAAVCRACTDGNTPAEAQCAHAAGGSGPTYMSVSDSPDGPWSAPQRLFAAQAGQTNMDTNLAVEILSNGSAVGIGRTGGAPTGIVTHLVTAADWRDPDSYVGQWGAMLFPNTTLVPDAGLEDPFVYWGAGGPGGAGVLHAVFHNQIEADDERLCGGHAYSEPPYTDWVFTGTSWSNEVRFAGGGEEGGGADEAYRFSRMERPHLVFGDAQQPRRITGLTAGVQFGAAAPLSVPGQDACYTLFQPVQTGETGSHR
eukprot:g4368.t1